MNGKDCLRSKSLEQGQGYADLDTVVWKVRLQVAVNMS